MDAIVNNTLHYLGFAVLFAALAVELALFRTRIKGTAAAALARVDALYGLAALVVLATGLLRVFLYGKTPGYYGQNFVFHIKVTLFVIIVLLSIVPTIRFFKARRAAPDAVVEYPASTGVLLRVEMVLLVFMPLLGVLMAHGYGYTG